MTGSTDPLRRERRWRLGTPLAIAACGALFAVSALNSHGTDLRPGRYTDLYQFVGSEADRYQRLEDRVAQLTTDVNTLTAEVADTNVRRLRAEAGALQGRAGFTATTGEGVRITLHDAPSDLIEATTGDDATLMVVHQQDVQAVVNALWSGGARAISINGQRIITTTGIKCNGSTISLQGVPYPQPFVIEAVGAVDDLTRSLISDTTVALIRAQALDPAIGLGWSVETPDILTIPAYAGLRDLSYARPLS